MDLPSRPREKKVRTTRRTRGGSPATSSPSHRNVAILQDACAPQVRSTRNPTSIGKIAIDEAALIALFSRAQRETSNHGERKEDEQQTPLEERGPRCRRESERRRDRPQARQAGCRSARRRRAQGAEEDRRLCVARVRQVRGRQEA